MSDVKIRLKFGCSLIYLSAQLKNSSFIFKTVLLLNNENGDNKTCSNNGKLYRE